MAGKVANGEKDWFVFFAGFFEGLIAPRVPIHWIVGVQEKVGTLRMNEPVGVGIFSRSLARLRRLPILGLCGDLGGGRSLSGSFHRRREDEERYAAAKQLRWFMLFVQSRAPSQRSFSKSKATGRYS
jgi:hypothetical protein